LLWYESQLKDHKLYHWYSIVYSDQS